MQRSDSENRIAAALKHLTLAAPKGPITNEIKLKHQSVLLKLRQHNSNWHLMSKQHLAGVPSEGSQWGQTFSLKRSLLSLKHYPRFLLWLTRAPQSAGGVCAVHAICTLWFDVDCLWLTLPLPRVLLLPQRRRSPHRSTLYWMYHFHGQLFFHVRAVAFSSVSGRAAIFVSQPLTTFTRFLTQMLYIYLNENLSLLSIPHAETVCLLPCLVPGSDRRYSGNIVYSNTFLFMTFCFVRPPFWEASSVWLTNIRAPRFFSGNATMFREKQHTIKP